MPNGYDMRANKLSLEDTKNRLDAIINDSREAVNNTPDHADYLSQFGAMASTVT